MMGVTYIMKSVNESITKKDILKGVEKLYFQEYENFDIYFLLKYSGPLPEWGNDLKMFIYEEPDGSNDVSSWFDKINKRRLYNSLALLDKLFVKGYTQKNPRWDSILMARADYRIMVVSNKVIKGFKSDLFRDLLYSIGECYGVNTFLKIEMEKSFACCGHYSSTLFEEEYWKVNEDIRLNEALFNKIVHHTYGYHDNENMRCLLLKILIKSFFKFNWDYSLDSVKNGLIYHIYKYCDKVSVAYDVSSKIIAEAAMDYLGHLIDMGFVTRVKTGRMWNYFLVGIKTIDFHEQYIPVHSKPLHIFKKYTVGYSYDTLEFKFRKNSKNNFSHSNSAPLINKLSSTGCVFRADYVKIDEFKRSICEYALELKILFKYYNKKARLLQSLKYIKNPNKRYYISELGRIMKKIKNLYDIIFTIRLFQIVQFDVFYLAYFSDSRGRGYQTFSAGMVYNKVLRACIVPALIDNNGPIIPEPAYHSNPVEVGGFSGSYVDMSIYGTYSFVNHSFHDQYSICSYQKDIYTLMYCLGKENKSMLDISNGLEYDDFVKHGADLFDNMCDDDFKILCTKDFGNRLKCIFLVLNIKNLLNGKIVYLQDLTITIDATASVFQNIAIILGIKDSMLWTCNFTDKWYDPYTVYIDFFKKNLYDTHPDFVKYDSLLTRNNLKKSIMISNYNGSVLTKKKYFFDELGDSVVNYNDKDLWEIIKKLHSFNDIFESLVYEKPFSNYCEQNIHDYVFKIGNNTVDLKYYLKYSESPIFSISKKSIPKKRIRKNSKDVVAVNYDFLTYIINLNATKTAMKANIGHALDTQPLNTVALWDEKIMFLSVHDEIHVNTRDYFKVIEILNDYYSEQIGYPIESRMIWL